MIKTRKIAHHHVALITRQDLASKMVTDYEDVKNSNGSIPPKLIFSANGQGLSYYASDHKFADDLKQADLIHADGQSLVIFSRLSPGPSLPDRICTTDFFHDAAKVAEEAGISFYFLGGTESVNKDLISEIKNLYPALKIAGRRNGYFQLDEIEDVISEVEESKADVIWVGIGRPLQERFCVMAKEKLHGATWLKTCGGLYDYITQRQARAPLWMQRIGVEWVFRALQEPKRLAGRYIRTNIHALYLMLRHSDFR